ncbi:MAG: COX15/CtaA family protein [Gammaproteobacteria bacterium]
MHNALVETAPRDATGSLLWTVRLTALLAFVVVVVGAYVRLSNAGLGCPDWPGCYGELTVPSGEEGVHRAQALYPDRPLEAHKAWKEMAHRYLAGTLALLIFWIAFQALRRPGGLAGRYRALPLGIAALVVFQALLGMWTVTWKLQPLVVVTHLLGGLATLGLLVLLSARLGAAARHREGSKAAARLRPLAWLALALLVIQVALGGWTSSNYAVYACPDFPTCQGAWWPEMDFAEGFTLWREIGPDYEGGILDAPARTAIHQTHRIGAVVVTILLLLLVVRTFRLHTGRALRCAATALGLLVLIQFSLGVTIAVFTLPLPAAAAHNGVAAALVATLVFVLHQLYPLPAQPHTPVD